MPLDIAPERMGPASATPRTSLEGSCEVATAVEVQHLRKTYGSTVAVDDVSFSVREGEIFGILGPNGAGKTTTVECVQGLRGPDEGTIRVLGLDPATQAAQLRQCIGSQLQDSALPGRIRVAEAIELFAAFALVVIFGSVPGMNHPETKLGGLTYFDVYFPIVIALSVAILALVSLPIHLADYRDKGILRRLSTTPLPPSWMLGAQLVINLAMTALALAVVVVVGTTAYSLGAPKQLGGFVLAVFLTVAAMFAIGLWLSAWVRSGAVASGAGQLILYPLLFFAGLWVPREQMTPVLRDIGDWTPLGAAVQAMQSSMQGDFPTAQSLLVLVAYAVIFAVFAVRYFRWE